MSDQNQPQSELASEFQKLGQNIQQVVQAAVESDEFKKFREEMQQGLSDLGESLNNFVKELSDTPTGQKVRNGLDNLQEKARQAEIETKVRQEVLSALQKANLELEKASARWKPAEGGAEPGDAPTPETPAPDQPSASQGSETEPPAA